MIYQPTFSYHEETAIENSHTVLLMELSKEEETNFSAVLKRAIKYAPFLRLWWGKQSCYFMFLLVKQKLDYLSFFLFTSLPL